MIEFFIVIAAHLLAVISPGPDFAIVMRNSMVFSRKIGVYTSLGIALGILVHVAYSLIGIGFIISQSILLFNIIKILGAMYLMYIGAKMLLAKSSSVNVNTQSSKETTTLEAVKMGFITNVLNPKATLFFVSLFSQVISADTSLFIKLLYSAEMTIMTFVWFAFVSFVLTIPALKKQFERYLYWIEKAIGVVLVSLGLRLFFVSK